MHVIGPTPLPGPAASVVRILERHVTTERRARIEAVALGRTLGIVPLLDNVADPHNGAAILRSCDAFGVHRVHVLADERTFYGTSKVTRGADRWLDIVQHEEPDQAVDAIEREGYALYVADMNGEHTPESLADVQRLAICFGNERRGVRDAIRARARGGFRVPMLGMVESLNVSVAAAVSLYTLARDRPRVRGEELDEVRARLLLATVTDAAVIVGEMLRTRTEVLE